MERPRAHQLRRGSPKPATIATLCAVLASAGVLAGCASASGGGSGSSANIGVATTLSGAFGSYGQAGLNGIKLAVNQLNSSGGLLGKKVGIVTGDDQVDPATGETVTRNLILKDRVVALFGSVSSAVAAAQETLSAQYRVPVFFHLANDASLMQGRSRTYAFEFSPNTDMEPAAAALAFAREIGKRPVRIATITPNYEFGLDTVKTFLSDLKRDGASYTVTNQQTPALGASSYSSNLAAIVSSNPQYVFAGQYGSDLITLTKQGLGLGLFKKATVGGMYDYDVLKALGAQAPAGAIAWDRAPFWTGNSAALNNFTSRYKAAYGSYPNEFAIIGYTAVQAWEQAVRKAGSFAAGKVAAALAGATVPTVRGDTTIRACDHQAEVPEYTGEIASAPSPQYGAPLWTNAVTDQPARILGPCS